MTLYTLVDIAATFSECALTVYFIDHIPVLESSERNKIRSLLCICIVFAFSLLADYFDKSGTVSGILGLLLTVLYCVFTKIGNCLVKAVFPILNMLAVLFINTAVISFFAYKNEVPVLDLIAFETDERIAILIVTKILYFVFIFISLKLLNIMQQKLFYIKVKEIFLIFLILSLTFLVEIILFTFIIRYNINIFSVYLINFAIFINSVLCIYLLFYVNQKNQAQMNAELLEQKLISEEAHIRGTRQLYNELSKMRHDYKGHLTCTLGLLHDRQYETAVHYIENLIDQKLDAYTGIFHSDFDILNTLLNVQANICRSAGIKYSASILCSSTGSISDIDLSILLSNLFDNSVRACKECESPSIDIEFSNIKSYFVICIKNTIKESVLKNNHDLTTTKNDKALHGFGKQIISDIATKYSGIYNYYEEDLFFITEIWLL